MLFRQRQHTLTVHTPAKLNLFLELHGKRSDGFHELETLMATVRLYDTLSFTSDDAGDISLEEVQTTRRHPDDSKAAELPPAGENLVVRAARLLKRAAGTRMGARIRLLKRIPVASGLAGGSSDAAATLAALNRLWRLGLPRRRLQELAAELGSDVGFFLAEMPWAICRGRGEIIEPLHLPVTLQFVIVRPQTGLSTAEVYRHSGVSDHPRNVSSLIADLSRQRIGRMARGMHNALQPAAERLNPEIPQIKRRFDDEPFAAHLMSGSGSACFGICFSRRQAARSAARLRAGTGWAVYAAQLGP